jgi:hypothetical protein
MIVELPFSCSPRDRGEGKKITWRDRIAAIRHFFALQDSGPQRQLIEKGYSSFVCTGLRTLAVNAIRH